MDTTRNSNATKPTVSSTNNENLKKGAAILASAAMGAGAMAAADAIINTDADHTDETLLEEATNIASSGAAPATASDTDANTTGGNDGGTSKASDTGTKASSGNNDDDVVVKTTSDNTTGGDTDDITVTTTGDDKKDTATTGGDETTTDKEPDLDELIVDNVKLPEEDHDLVAQEVLDLQEIDPDDVEPDTVMAFEQMGTVYLIDGTEATAATFHMADGTEGTLIDTTGDGVFDTFEDEALTIEITNPELQFTVDDAQAAINSDQGYMAYDETTDHTDSYDLDINQDILS